MRRDSLETSAAWRALEATRRRFAAGIDGSVLVPTGEWPEWGRAATERSRAVAAADRWLRGSALYRWLTRDPDPTTITIDLRDSRIAAPIVAVLVRAVDRLYTAWTGSRLRVALGRLPWEWLSRSSACSALSAVFAPPPERDETGTGSADASERGPSPRSGGSEHQEDAAGDRQ